MKAWVEVVNDMLHAPYEEEVGWRVFLGANPISRIMKGTGTDKDYDEVAELIVFSDTPPDYLKSMSGWWLEIPLEE